MLDGTAAGDAFTAAHIERFKPQIRKDNPYLAAIILVDRAGRVQAGDAVLQRQARARADLDLMAGRDGDGGAGGVDEVGHRVGRRLVPGARDQGAGDVIERVDGDVSQLSRLLSTFAGTGRAAPPAQPLDPLTDREEQVLLTIARGRTNAEIAAELHISLSTVKTHIGSLMAKLGARNRVEVAMWGYETGRVRE